MENLFKTTLVDIGATVKGADEVWHILASAYEGPNRHYHTLVHIGKCLDCFEEFLLTCFYWKQISPEGYPKAVRKVQEAILAIYFHDYIYEIDKDPGYNEEQSAIEAEKILIQVNCNHQVNTQNIKQHILATTHEETLFMDPWSQIVADVDLVSLGAPWHEFCANNRMIMREYTGKYSNKEFLQGNKAFLEKLTAHGLLFGDTTLRTKYEAPARNNIKRWLKTIS